MHDEPDENNGSIDFERSTFQYGVQAWKDPHVLWTLYNEHDLSQSEVAEELGTTQQNISEWMGDFGFESEPPMHKRNPSISKSKRADGKVQFHVPDGNGGRERVYRHQLVALLVFDAGEVFAEDTHIHHEMGGPVALDVPENLDVLGAEEHIRGHAGGGIVHHPEIVLREMFDEDDPLNAEGDAADGTREQSWSGSFEEMVVTDGGERTDESDA